MILRLWSLLQELIKNMKDIAIYGAGGFGREVACLLNAINANDAIWNLIGFFDDVKRLDILMNMEKCWVELMD